MLTKRHNRGGGVNAVPPPVSLGWDWLVALIPAVMIVVIAVVSLTRRGNWRGPLEHDLRTVQEADRLGMPH